uniref:Uncharacterized protein n=1 Tax=Podoviridae sp. ctYFd1 TaxID=2826560 RepID=A0A8S5R1L9_9CAUD|nr:MAG TPA: hypothetical protein [Podoviridae sp. ctYFd1]
MTRSAVPSPVSTPEAANAALAAEACWRPALRIRSASTFAAAFDASASASACAA